MTCYAYCNAEDGNGNALTFDVTFKLYDRIGSDWVYEGTYTIPPGAITQLTVPEGNRLKAVPNSKAGWVTPPDIEFIACEKDIYFIYKKIICSSGAKKCIGDDVYKCSDDGTKWVFSKNCPGGCLNGDCIPGTTCTQSFTASADTGVLPFNPYFNLFKGTVQVGQYQTPASVDLDIGDTYLVEPLVPVGQDENWEAPSADMFVACTTAINFVYTAIEVPQDPVITSIGWSPTGSCHTVGGGASFIGQHGSEFRVIAVGPSTTPSLAVEEIMVELAGGAPRVYKRNDTFMLDGEGFTILHAISTFETDVAVIAKNISTNQHPTVGEEVQFSANINWNDDGATTTTRRMEWYYLKPPSESYTKVYADDINNWTHFATDTLPAHTFTAIDDVDIIYLKVIAQNKANQTAEFGFGRGVDGLFNLWGGADGFEITVVDAAGTDNLTIMTAELVPSTNTWMVGVIVMRWDAVTNRVYFGTRDAIGCAYSDPQPNLCGTMVMQVGAKYTVFRSTSFISVVPGESVFELKSGRTSVIADRSYLNFLEASICGFFGLSGSECTSFVAELVDTVYVANYASIMLTGKDTFGNERELTWFDHVALPFALLGSLVPIPCAAIVRKGGYAVAKISEKVFSVAVAKWAVMSVFDTPAGSLHKFDEKIGFSRAIVYVGQSTAEEIVKLLDVDDTGAAYTMLQNALNKIDPDDASTFNDGFDWHEFNSVMKTKFDDPNLYGEYLRQSSLISGWADQIKTAASKATPTSAEKTAIINAMNEPAVMKVIGEDTTATLQTLGQVTNPVAKANKVNAVENVAKNMPAAFDDVAKASIYDVSGYLIKHDVIENVLGKTTCSANYEMTTRLFKRLFDGVDEVALASTECDGLMAIAKEDPTAMAKAFGDYTIKTDKERLLLSLSKSGTKGEEAAAWIASAKKNFDLSDVHQRFGTTVYDVVNDPSQVAMHGPHGVYTNDAIDAMVRAADTIPDFLQPETGYKFIQDTAETVRIHATADDLADLVSKAQAKDTRGIADIFIDAGVDTIQSNLIADQLWSVSHRIEVLGDVIQTDDLTTLTDRMVEANVVEGSNLFKDMIDRVVKDGTITTDALKSFFDVANHNPVEVALAMEKIPAGAIASFENVLNSMGTKGKILLTLMDTRTSLKSQLGEVSDTILSSWARTTPLGLRLSRTQGDGFGSGVFKSLSVHNRLLEWAGDHWRALVIVLGAIGTAKFATYWFAFEWQPFHAVLRKADVLEERVAEKYTDVMYAAGNNMSDLDWNVDKQSVRESVYDSVGILCELADYAEKNPIPGDKLATMQETFNLYVGTSAGIVGNSLHVDIQKDLKQLLMKYNEQFLECVDAKKCTMGDECVTGEMAYDQRKISEDKLTDANAYQTIIDATWGCVPGHAGFGTIRCTSNQVGFAVYLDGEYIDHSYGNTWLVIQNVPIGAHTVKIEKGTNYTPECCEDIATVTDGGTVTYDCQMTKIGDCSLVSSVIISLTPKNPIKDEPVAFTSYATSDDPIETWEWDFGDETPKVTGQAVTHTYTKIGIFKTTLTVTNDCGNSDSVERMVTVLEEPVEESGTLLVKEPIDSVTSEKCAGSWTAEIYVDDNTIGKTTQFSIPFGTNEYIGGYGGQCGDHVIKVVLSGYDDAVKSVTIDDGDSKSWQPVMSLHGTAVGTVKLASNQTGFAGYIDGKFVGNSGTNNYLDVPNVAVGSRTVKIVKGMGYTPEFCEGSVTVTDGGTVAYDCQMSEITLPEHTISVEVPVGSTLWVDGNVVT